MIRGAWTVPLLILAAVRPAASVESGPPGMMGGAAPPGQEAPRPAASDPVPAALEVGFDQKLGGQVPLDLEFRDEDGRPVRLGDLLGGRPAILSLAYYGCPMLCGMAIEGIASSLKPLGLEPGRDFQVITVSFDPRDTPERARARRTQALDFYGRPEAAAGWRFLIGAPPSIQGLTAAVGFRYAWDEEEKQFAHATGVVLLTPAGRISRYFFGVEYAPRDLRLGLVEAGENRIGTLADRLLLLCYRYDPKTGRYSAAAVGLVRAGGVLTILALGAFVLLAVRRDRRRAAAGPGAAAGNPPPEPGARTGS